MESLAHGFEHDGSGENYDHRKQKLPDLKNDCGPKKEKFSMLKFALQHAPMDEPESLGHSAEGQQRQHEEEQQVQKTALSAVGAFPCPDRRKRQENRLDYRP